MCGSSVGAGRLSSLNVACFGADLGSPLSIRRLVTAATVQQLPLTRRSGMFNW